VAKTHRDVSVKHYDLAQAFVELSERMASADEIEVAFREGIAELGFRYFACCSHVDPLRPPPLAVVLHSYPAAWVRSFSERKLFQIDPVYRYADKTLLPFAWDSRQFRAGLTRQQRDVLAEAADYGIAHGYTIPIHLPSPFVAFSASCSVVPDAISLPPSSYHAVQLMAYHLYERASRERGATYVKAGFAELSARERECLELVAQGKSDWVVGKVLGISERTVHNHIERAKRRLKVTTRVQAIVHALFTRQIAFGTVIKSEAVDLTAER
jgi:DNA-binding CsgD family transcriptional regulator